MLKAAQKGHLEVIKVLLAPPANADVDKPMKNGRTPLQMASAAGHVEVVKALIEAGASVDLAEATGPLSMATLSVAGMLRELEGVLGARVSDEGPAVSGGWGAGTKAGLL